MPLVQLRFTHPNTGRQYHGELWEVDEATASELQELLDREDIWEELIDGQAFDQSSPTSDVVKSLLHRGRLIHKCQPVLAIDLLA